MNILEIYPKISNKYIPLSLLDVSTRNYIHWKKENLLFRYADKPTNTIEKRERILLNVFDAKGKDHAINSKISRNLKV